MEPSTPYYPPPLNHFDSSRSTLFPLGTGLLLIVIFSLSGILSFCYHWERLRHLRASFADADLAVDRSVSKPKNTCSEPSENENQSFPVVMAGDRIARFIALPCPCEPARRDKVVVEQVQKTQKPPHVALTLS